MADVQRRVTKAGEVRWDVRYRDDARHQRKRSFERKVDAQRFARSVETDLLRGDWIDPRRGKELFGVWAEMWMETLGSGARASDHLGGRGRAPDHHADN